VAWHHGPRRHAGRKLAMNIVGVALPALHSSTDLQATKQQRPMGIKN
jgi:hypothetical protein